MSTNNITLDYHKCHHFQRAKLILIQGIFSSKLDVCMYVTCIFSAFLTLHRLKYIYLITTSLFLPNDLYFILRLPSFSFRCFSSDLQILGTSVLRLLRFLTIIISFGALEFLRQTFYFLNHELPFASYLHSVSKWPAKLLQYRICSGLKMPLATWIN